MSKVVKHPKTLVDHTSGAAAKPMQFDEVRVLERREAIEKQLQDRFRHIPKEVSLVDELIAERRAGAAKEAAEG
ncbi:MAG: hypothetical protein V4457_01285 [Pseudomonadota bacterium]